VRGERPVDGGFAGGVVRTRARGQGFRPDRVVAPSRRGLSGDDTGLLLAAGERQRAIDDAIRSWFEDSDHIDELLRVETGRVGKRERVGYLFAVTNPDGKFLVEQQAYYETKDGVITWMRVLCSGYQPVPPAGGGAA
jgi:hypothetical protein